MLTACGNKDTQNNNELEVVGGPMPTDIIETTDTVENNETNYEDYSVTENTNNEEIKTASGEVRYSTFDEEDFLESRKNYVYIAGTEYNGDIDYVLTDDNWDAFAEESQLNPNKYIGKVVKVEGSSYIMNDEYRLIVNNDVSTAIKYVSTEYPPYATHSGMIGRLEYDEFKEELYIDSILLYQIKVDMYGTFVQQ